MPVMLPAPAVPVVPAVPTLPAVPALGFSFSRLLLLFGLSGPGFLLQVMGRKLPERLATPMRGHAQSLSNVVADEAARVPASQPLAGPFCVSFLPFLPLL